jgi:hypothetical protein
VNTCLDCWHLEIENDLGYSDATPGEGLQMRCQKGHWTLCDPDVLIKAKLKTNLVDAAQGCPDFRTDDPREPCPACGGSGRVPYEVPGMCQTVDVVCPTCGGTKRVYPAAVGT